MSWRASSSSLSKVPLFYLLPCPTRIDNRFSGSTQPWKSIAEATRIPGNTSFSVSLSLASSWIAECTNHHGTCRSNAEASTLPTRVLDVRNSKVKLHLSKGEQAQYICLSHCWGQSQPLRNTKATLSSLTQGIAWNSLSQTFQDAIVVTRTLGICYLWIDSLCIVQDDNEDWEKEASTDRDY